VIPTFLLVCELSVEQNIKFLEHLKSLLLILASTVNTDYLIDTSILPETVYKDLWFCRKTFCALSLATMVICIIR